MSNRKQVLVDLKEIEENFLDTVPSGAYNQVRWERDVALAQLESYGVGLGEKADIAKVVHGRWLSAYEYALKLGVTDKEMLEEAKKDKWWKFCNDCEQQVKGFHNYCPNCGAKMDGDRNGQNQ